MNCFVSNISTWIWVGYWLISILVVWHLGASFETKAFAMPAGLRKDALVKLSEAMGSVLFWNLFVGSIAIGAEILTEVSRCLS